MLELTFCQIFQKFAHQIFYEGRDGHSSFLVDKFLRKKRQKTHSHFFVCKIFQKSYGEQICA